MNRLPIGIMQGRLLPSVNGRFQAFPADDWRKEFPLAASAGLDLIEWIFEVYGAEKNPLANDQALKEMKELSDRHGVAVRSVCADYFMDRPLLSDVDQGTETLRWLVKRCSLAGIHRTIIPFVDVSRIPNREAEKDLIALFAEVTSDAERNGVEIHLETDLSPERFAALMAQLPESVFKVNYDSGNSAALGYKVLEEFAAYGSRIGSLHIKDRVLGGGTVPLGTGNADFPALHTALESVGYCDDIILQVAREREGNELEWIRSVRESVEKILFQNGEGDA